MREEAFGAGVGDPVGEVGQQPGLVTFGCLCRVDDRFEPGVGGPEVPAREVLGAPAAALVGPKVPQAFLDCPCAGAFEVAGPQCGEAVLVTVGKVLGRVQPQVFRAGQAFVTGGKPTLSTDRELRTRQNRPPICELTRRTRPRVAQNFLYCY